jgi:upstream activation factor subunit UAF30
MATLDSLALDIAAVQKDLKALRKMVRKVIGDIEDPTGEKKEARTKNNGFNKPQVVTDALRSFLKLGPDEMISRSQVTKAVNAYVTEKELKKGQNITLDAPLQALLSPPEGTQITFLNIQKFLNQHYVKQEAPPKETKAPKEPKAPKETTAEKPARPKVKKAAASSS